jgi:hypothetical protein
MGVKDVYGEEKGDHTSVQVPQWLHHSSFIVFLVSFQWQEKAPRSAEKKADKEAT